MATKIITCRYCGKKVDLYDYNPKDPAVRTMDSEQCCFDCVFWANYMKHPAPNTYIVSGKLMKIKLDPRPFRNCKYAVPPLLLFNMRTGWLEWAFEFYTLTVVPDHIRTVLPDQMKIVDRESYVRMARHGPGRTCTWRGCFDRYNCFWYNAKKVEADSGAFNVITGRYTPGIEGCASFVDKNTMFE